MVVVGVLTWLGLSFLGIELAATLAIVAALLTFIPNFGPIISAVPAVLLGLMQSPMTALWVVLLYIVVQLIESNLVTPLLQYRALSLPPVLVITAQLAASVWMGVLGLVVSTPLLIVATVLVRNLTCRVCWGRRRQQVRRTLRDLVNQFDAEGRRSPSAAEIDQNR